MTPAVLGGTIGKHNTLAILMQIISASSSHALAASIAKILQATHIKAKAEKFADGELDIRLEGTISSDHI